MVDTFSFERDHLWLFFEDRFRAPGTGTHKDNGITDTGRHFQRFPSAGTAGW